MLMGLYPGQCSVSRHPHSFNFFYFCNFKIHTMSFLCAQRWKLWFLQMLIDSTGWLPSQKPHLTKSDLVFLEQSLDKWSPAHLMQFGLRWQKDLVCPYFWQLEHCGICLLGRGGSNWILRLRRRLIWYILVSLLFSSCSKEA